MEIKELLERSIMEIEVLRRDRAAMSRELRIVEVFARLIVPQSDGAMAPDIVHELRQALQRLQRPE
jgi:hypothetical protein